MGAPLVVGLGRGGDERRSLGSTRRSEVLGALSTRHAPVGRAGRPSGCGRGFGGGSGSGGDGAWLSVAGWWSASVMLAVEGVGGGGGPGEAVGDAVVVADSSARLAM